jgi:excisionase family DNA binding protein
MATGSHDDEQPWLTVSEAARRLGVSRQAVAHRIKRGTLTTRSSNRGILVRIPAAAPDAPVAAIIDDKLAQPLQQQVAVLKQELADLKQRLAERDAEIDRVRSLLVNQEAAHRAERTEMLTSAAAERERLLGLLERATVRPSMLERLMALIRPNRP